MRVRKITGADIANQAMNELYDASPGLLRGELRTAVAGKNVAENVVTHQRAQQSEKN